MKQPWQKTERTAISPAQAISRALRAAADPGVAHILQSFFKTGPGEYGEGDVFLGVKVPVTRRSVRQFPAASPRQALALLKSPFHEERLAGLLLWVQSFEKGDARVRKEIFNLYLRHTRWINSWDLVDLSAPQIVGGSLKATKLDLLNQLAGSKRVWDRRIAVVATLTFIRRNDFTPCLRLCRQLLNDEHDLMHKACGWMLREVGKRDRDTLRAFLEAHAHQMPRTMLRYSLEHFQPDERQHWMGARAKGVASP